YRLGNVRAQKQRTRLMHTRLLIAATSTTLCLSLTACGSPLERPIDSNTSPELQWGQAEFALVSDTDGVQYALRDARFSIVGPETVTLESNQSPDAPTLVQELQSGQYSIELLPGYRLVRVTADGEEELDATLETPNPQTLLISADQTTAVTY